MKNWIAVGLSVILMAGMLAVSGCGETVKTEDGTSAASQPPPPPPGAMPGAPGSAPGGPGAAAPGGPGAAAPTDAAPAPK